MEKKSVLICGYCGGLINQDKMYMHELERSNECIDHEGFFHQECFINSIIKDLERLNFKVIRPRSEFKTEEEDQDQGFPLPTPDVMKLALSMASPLLNSLGKTDLQAEKEKALEKVKSQNGKQKREKKKKAVGTRKNK